MDGYDHERPANSGGHPQPCRSVGRAHRGKRQRLKRMPTDCNSSLLRAASALGFLLVLAGCPPGGQFDPTEMFNSDVFNTKTKLKGDRVPLFPDGVPGTTTGVPADLVKGYQPPPDQTDADASQAPAGTVPGAGPPGAGAAPGGGPAAAATAEAKPK